MGTFKVIAPEDVPDDVDGANPGSMWLWWRPVPRKPRWLVRVDWTRVAGRLECCGVEVQSVRTGGQDWPPELPSWDVATSVLSTTLLRQLPLGAMLSKLQRDAWDRTASNLASAGDDDDYAEVVKAFARMSSSTRPSLAEVARVYTEAQQRREPPTEAVRRAFGVEHSTAAKYVMRARAEHFLPPWRSKGSKP